MINLSLDELKLIAKSRSVKDYENKSEEDLIKILSEAKPKIGLSKKKIKVIKKDFSKLRHSFSNSKIEFRKSLYDLKTQRNLSAAEIKEIEKNLHELEESLFKRYHDYDDDIKYYGIKDVRNLFDHYYKPIKTKSTFNGNYIEYESKGDKDKNLSLEEYLDMIRPYLRDKINDHKTLKILGVPSSNKVIDYETQFGEWNIQLTVKINFNSSKDSGETHTMHTKSDN